MARTYDDTMFIDTFEHEYTWLNGFMRNVHRYAKNNAVIDPETNRTWNYKELNEEANKLAHALQDDGIQKDDVIMTALRNSPEFAFNYVGPRKVGAILLAANFNLAAGEMALLIDHNEPKVLIYSANVKDTIVEAEKLCKKKSVRFVLADNLENVEIPEGHVSYEEYTKEKSTEEPQINFRHHIYDEVLRLCTSGTTALPKSVPINDINEVLSAHDIIMQFPLNVHDVTLNMTPWFHRGGCHCGGTCPAFYVGCAVIIMRKFQPNTALEWVSTHGVTFLIGAPSNLEVLARSQERQFRDLSNLRGVITMGAPLSRAACMKYMSMLTPNIFNGYGTTETLWNSFLRPYNLPDGAGSVGGSCIDDEVRVVKIYDDKKAEPDELVPTDGKSQGEVIIMAPEKSTYTYYNNPEMAETKFYNGWMYTGDTGTWNDEWIVTIRGRKDDMMVVSGENIYPTQIEEALLENPKVKDCIVTCVPDKLRGQAVVAYVITNDETLTIRELAEFCAKSPMLSKYKRPRYFAFIEKIPMTATGKKMHYAMKEQAAKDLEAGLLRKD